MTNNYYNYFVYFDIIKEEKDKGNVEKEFLYFCFSEIKFINFFYFPKITATSLKNL